MLDYWAEVPDHMADLAIFMAVCMACVQCYFGFLFRRRWQCFGFALTLVKVDVVGCM